MKTNARGKAAIASRPFALALATANSDIKGLTAFFLNLGAFAAAYLALDKVFGAVWPWSLILAALPFVGFAFLYFVPAWLEAKGEHQRRIYAVDGIPKNSRYFRLTPYDEEDTFSRADEADKSIIRWIQRSTEPVLYLYGQSGVGKSSLLSSGVIPVLKRKESGWIAISLLLEPNLDSEIKEAFLKPQAIWRDPSRFANLEVDALLERADRHAKENNRRILVIIDQFEEFFITLDASARHAWINLIQKIPLMGKGRWTILLSLRIEYLSDLSCLGLAPPTLGQNCEVVRPFSRAAAHDFLIGSGLKLEDEFVSNILSEAQDIEEFPDRIRAVVINMIGLVLSSFKGALPRGIDPRRLLLGYVEASISEKSVRNFSRPVLRTMITSGGTNRRRPLSEIASEAKLSLVDTRGTLVKLAFDGLVRAYEKDRPESELWEFSHDFVAKLVQPLVHKWRHSLFNKIRAWFVPISISVWLLIIGLSVVSVPFVRHAIALQELARGGIVQTTQGQFVYFQSQLDDDLKDVDDYDFYRALEYFNWLNGNASLSINHGRIFTGFKKWPVIKNVSVLQVSNNRPVGFDLDNMPELPSLWSLNLEASDSIISFKGMPSFPKLMKLYIRGNSEYGGVETLGELPRLPLLETLVIEGEVGALSGMRDQPNLKTLTLGATTGSLAEIPILQKLEEFSINLAETTDLSKLPSFPALKTLTLYCKDSKNSISLKGIPKLPLLEKLESYCTPDEDFAPLSALPSLKVLALSSSQATTVQGFPQLGNLEELIFYGEKWTSLGFLPRLEHLESLTIGGAPNIRSLSDVVEQPKLTELILNPSISLSSYNFPSWMNIKSITTTIAGQRDIDALARIASKLTDADISVQDQPGDDWSKMETIETLVYKGPIHDLKFLSSLKKLKKLKIESPASDPKLVDFQSLMSLPSSVNIWIVADSNICFGMNQEQARRIACEGNEKP